MSVFKYHYRKLQFKDGHGATHESAEGVDRSAEAFQETTAFEETGQPT
jgi:hypothetical protein